MPFWRLQKQPAAVRLQRSVGSSRLSAEHLYFCGYPNVTQELQPSCSSAGMLIKDGATALARLVNQGQVPVPDDCFEFVPKSVWDPRRDCKARTSSCSNSPLVSMLRAGRLTWLPLSSMWQMQQHIRSFGSIVCPITLSPTLRTNASVAAVYNGPGASEDVSTFYSHAVQVVGYDNNRQAWLARNSWGTDFAMNGYFWVNFSAPGMCDGSDTFGPTFLPDVAPAPPARLPRADGKADCFTYKAQPGDYPEKLVDRYEMGLFGVQRLVQDNAQHMPELDRFTPGAPLVLCGVDPGLWPASPTLDAPAAPPPRAFPIASIASNTTDFQLQPLMLAASPQVFDGRSAWRGLSVLGPVQDQGPCGTSVAFAVLGAAQTAAAVALNTSVPATVASAHDLYFCAPRSAASARSCGTGMSFVDALASFTSAQGGKDPIALNRCVPYQPDKGADACNRKCGDTLSQIWPGKWRWVEITGNAEQWQHRLPFARSSPRLIIGALQLHIRRHGSILCPLALYTDLREFYRANPSGVYLGPGKGARYEERTAVQVVGYDNVRKAWLYKQTWGAAFAMDGFAWISYNAPGMCEESYAVPFTPDRRLPPPPLNPAPGKSGCFIYTAQPGDYPTKLMDMFGLGLKGLQRLILDNQKYLPELHRFVPGAPLLLCGVDPRPHSNSSAVSGAPKPINAKRTRGSSGATRPGMDG